MAQPKAGQPRDFGGGTTNETTPVGFLYFRRGRRRCITGRGSDGNDMYTAARPVHIGLQQRPAHGPCGVPRQVQVEPCDLLADWYFSRNWAVRSMARTRETLTRRKHQVLDSIH